MDEEYSVTELELDTPLAVLEARGRFNIRSVWDLQQRCDALYGRGYSFIVVEMSGVTFISSSGPGRLVRITYDFLERDGLFQIAAVPDAVTRVIDMLNSRQFLNIAADVDEARTRLGALTPSE